MIDEEILDRAVHFHGHLCPGLAMGIKAAEVALTEVGPHSEDEEVVAIVETDMCAVDGIQFLTGCTFGKGNLVYQEHGKCVYTFVRRSDGRAIRISTRPRWGPGDYEPAEAEAELTSATPDEKPAATEREREAVRILRTPIEEIYEVREVDVTIPPLARGFESVSCSVCGEATMETLVRRLDGRELCQPCFDEALANRAQ